MIEKKTTKVKATAKAVAFTGHREISHIHQEQVRERLKEAVLQAIRQGVSKFYCGMALGFDMMAAEEVLSLKLSIPMLKLVAVVPFKGQSASWSMVEQQRYAYILSKADDVVHLSEGYFNGCYFKRNELHAVAFRQCDCLLWTASRREAQPILVVRARRSRCLSSCV